MITEAQRLQYLEALGIQAWVSRERSSAQGLLEPDSLDRPEPEISVPARKLHGQQQGTQKTAGPARFEIGPGIGSTLLLCSRPEDAATSLASDIARCLDEAPVWGWLSQDTGGPGKAEAGLSLQQAIDERLFTRVLLFCDASAADQVGKDEVISSARIIYAPPFGNLAANPEQKRRLWTQLLTHGWCSRRS